MRRPTITVRTMTKVVAVVAVALTTAIGLVGALSYKEAAPGSAESRWGAARMTPMLVMAAAVCALGLSPGVGRAERLGGKWARLDALRSEAFVVLLTGLVLGGVGLFVVGFIAVVHFYNFGAGAPH